MKNSISVVIPNYNGKQLLESNIPSVYHALLSSDISDFEIIISDNCSTDSTFEIAKKYSEKDSRIKVYRHEKGMGAPFNFRYALLKSSSKYFIWLGAHDLLTQDYLQTGVIYLEENKNVLMVYPKANWIDNQNNFLSELDEDIQTIGISKKNALIKILKNADSGVAVHGIYVTSALKAIPFGMDVGGEVLMLFIIAIGGDIVRLDFIGLLFRLSRSETVLERLKRYRELKVLKSSFLNFTLIRIQKHLFYTWKFTGLSVIEKLIVSFHVIKKFMIIQLWIQYKQYFNKGNIKTVKT